MKATGIVRRIDDLGRVVIPKEIRRTMRIREGDPLEIFTERDGEVIFKKYSPIGELGSFALQYAETLSKTSGYPAIITDKDSIIAVSGISKRELTEKKISLDLEQIMQDKTPILVNANDTRNIPVAEGVDKYNASVVCPIISEGDSIGAVAFLLDETRSNVGEVEAKLAQSAAVFLGRQMEG
ncbi:MAG: stage V sporulation protein T [Clostridiales bacterium]|jgi:AbrB family transcriptional regulator (stage V sporulation protein T)|nr:stage V sporulation protein T [Clostridiales bacterium]